MPIAPRQWGTALQEFHCPLPRGTAALHCTSSTAHSCEAVGDCIAGVPTPTFPGQWNSCNALPHCLRAVDGGIPAMHYQTNSGRWWVELL